MIGRLFIVSGPSTCGKTWLLNSICETALASDLNIQMAPKFSTRAARKGKNEKDDLIQLFDASGNPSISLGKGPFYGTHRIEVDLGESGIDIAYALNNERYGLSTSKIREALDVGDCAIIVSEFRSIRRLRQAFPDEARTVYIASAVDPKKLAAEQARRYGVPESERRNLKGKIRNLGFASGMELWDRVAEDIYELNEYWKHFKPGGDGSDARAERIKAFHTRYVDHITLFDHVVLNFTEGAPEEMTRQMVKIVTDGQRRVYSREYPPIFVVAAASKAGKGSMLEMVGLIGKDRASLISKLAGRNRKENDKQDGMLAIGRPGEPPDEWPCWPEWWTEEMILCAKKGEFPQEYDLKWQFHETTSYAISSAEVEKTLRSGSAPIFISNMGQFDMFRERYGDRVVFLYLFRVSSAEDTAQHIFMEGNHDSEDARARMKEIRDVHEKYLDRIAEFDHVLLNTARPQDLYDQVFELLEHYHGIGQPHGAPRGHNVPILSAAPS